MAQCYHKACDGWDPSTRSPESPRFLAAVTRAVLDSVLEMAEEDVVNVETLLPTVNESEQTVPLTKVLIRS